MREAARRQTFYVGDKLYFNGYDVGQDRRHGGGGYDEASYDDYLPETDELYDQHPHLMLREKEDCLLQSALDRISQARISGQTNVNLTTDEMAALERRTIQQQEPTAPTSSALVSPPITPVKTKEKSKSSSRNSSSTSLKAQAKPRKNSSSFFGSSVKSSPKAKAKQSSVDHAAPLPPFTQGNMPPGVVPGPNGMMYAPVGYYNPPSPDIGRECRSPSKQSRRASTPPEFQPRFYTGRPASSGSNRSLPEDVDYYASAPRTHSASAHAYDYDLPSPMPAVQGRRNVSSPTAQNPVSDLRYASLRRVPPSSPLAQARAAPAGGSGLRRVKTGGSDMDVQGVQVDILPQEGGGYSIQQSSPVPVATTAVTGTATATPTKGGSDSRRRKSGRR